MSLVPASGKWRHAAISPVLVSPLALAPVSPPEQALECERVCEKEPVSPQKCVMNCGMELDLASPPEMEPQNGSECVLASPPEQERGKECGPEPASLQLEHARERGMKMALAFPLYLTGCAMQGKRGLQMERELGSSAWWWQRSP